MSLDLFLTTPLLDLFLTTPLHDGKVRYEYVAGVVQTLAMFGPQRFDMASRIGSTLPRLRDLLTTDFLVSGARYLLCVDSDVGFSGKDVQSLIASDRGLAEPAIVAGAYAIKSFTYPGVAATFNNERCGKLRGATYVGAGFLLMRREVVERMIAHYADLTYPADGASSKDKTTVGLWTPFCYYKDAPDKNTYLFEDYSFCKRWTDTGGKIWIDPDVKLQHMGDAAYTLQAEAMR